MPRRMGCNLTTVNQSPCHNFRLQPVNQSPCDNFRLQPDSEPTAVVTANSHSHTPAQNSIYTKQNCHYNPKITKQWQHPPSKDIQGGPSSIAHHGASHTPRLLFTMGHRTPLAFCSPWGIAHPSPSVHHGASHTPRLLFTMGHRTPLDFCSQLSRR
ncbi:hypothetical protein ACOMHN_050495 [Nucella lapillus]